ncbi:MAG: molybdopterin molybdotransferase MoeA [Candidatus Krumholzibacteriia bacterium]
MTALPPADDLLPLADLWPLLAAAVEPLPTREVQVDAALGRVLAAPAAAAWDLPPFTNSAMDGWAVRAADTAACTPLPLAEGDAYAGGATPSLLPPGHALPIGTGGRLPEGADAVLKKEDAEPAAGAVRPLRAVPAGKHVRRAGQERRAGQTVVAAGTLIGPRVLAALLAAGVTRVAVGARPRVRLVTTGSEVAPAGAPPGPGRIVDTNTPFLSASLARLLGEAPLAAGPVPDDEEALTAALGEALGTADLVITTGGVSVGDRDLVRGLLTGRLGVEPLVWRVAVKPGKPVFIGRRGPVWVVGLPGNPAAVAAHWHLTLRPLLLALQGAADPAPRWLPAVLGAAVVPERRRVWLRWCTLVGEGDELRALPLPGAESHMLADAARADALLAVPPGERPVPAGTRLPVLLLDGCAT